MNKWIYCKNELPSDMQPVLLEIRVPYGKHNRKRIKEYMYAMYNYKCNSWIIKEGNKCIESKVSNKYGYRWRKKQKIIIRKGIKM